MTRDESRHSWREPAFLLFLAGIAYLTIFRWRMAASLPLWLDESFTAVITSQPDWHSFVRQLWLDPSAPLYYLLMWPLPLHGDIALRLPGLVLMLATAALPLFWRLPGMSLGLASCWGLLLFSWAEGLSFSFDARPYALLLFLSTVQTTAFARLIEGPDLRRAMTWSGAAALAISTHYFAAVLALAQGLTLLAVRRRDVLRLWPALALLIPPLLILAWHYPRLALYAAPGVAWYPVYSGVEVSRLTLSTFGDKWPLMALAALIGIILARSKKRMTSAWIAALCGIATIVLLDLGGMMRPMLIARYLTPGIPGALLGLLLVASNPIGQLLVAAASLLTSTAVVRYQAVDRASLGLEKATAALLAAAPPPRRLVYSLGYAGQVVLDPSTTRPLGELAFKRRGLAMRADLIKTLHADPLEAAAGREAAIIWIYRTAQRAEVEALRHRRRCVDFPRAGGGTLACPALGRPA